LSSPFALERHGETTLKDTLLAAAFLLPSLVIFTTFFFYPLYRLFYLGLHQQNTFGTAERYVGWKQYTEVLGGKEFREGLLTSGRYVLLTVPLGLVLGVTLAVAANRRLRGIKVFQTIFASTIATSVAVASVLFLTLINPQVGYFRDVGFISLTDPATALRGVALSSCWPGCRPCPRRSTRRPPSTATARSAGSSR